MDIKELVTGTRFQLFILDNNGKITGNTYISQLYEPAKGKSIVISAPIFESRLIYIPINGMIQLAFPNNKYGFLGFTAKVTERGSKGNISVLFLSVETPIEKIQRRDYYRLDCNISVEYRICNSQNKNQITTAFKKGLSKNVSGSGACIIVGEEIKMDFSLQLRLHLSDMLVVDAICIVVRSIRLDMLSKNSKYELGLHFTDISQYNQDNIIKFIHEKQRWHLKKDVLGK